MDSVVKDLQYAFRTLFKNPGAALAAIFALMLGIGANSAIFSVVNGVLLRPLEYPAPDRLAILWEAQPGKGIHEFYVSPANYRDWLEQAHSFDAIAAYRPHASILTGGAFPERLEAASVSPRLLDLLGARPALGRAFTAGEDQPGHACVVMLGHGLWQRRFGGSRSVLGTSINLDGTACSIVGVADPGFRLLDTVSELWMPYALDSNELKERGLHTLKVIARLKSGVALEQARQEMQGIARGLERQFPDTNAGWTVEPVLVGEQVVGNIRPTLLMLFGAVCFVLLIACSNVAILLLTRASVRHKEIAIRAALGASRFRIVRQMITESMLLSLISGVLGLLFARVGIAVLVALKPANIPRLEEIRIDWQVAAFTLGVCLVTGFLFGMFPAITAVRTSLNEVLRDGGRTSLATVNSRRTRGVLVVSELALSVALLIGAGLMIRSFLQLQSVNPGFRAHHVLTTEVALPTSKYEGLQVALFYKRLVESMEHVPGVRSAAVARNVPLSGGDPSLNFAIEHRPELPSAEQPRAKYRAISASYFRGMGIPLIRGRYFEESDTATAPGVVIVNEVLARRFWPGEDPIGKRMRAGFDESSWSTVVGIVGNVKHAGLDTETNPEMYYPYLQVPATLMNFVEGSMTLVVETEDEPSHAAEVVRKQVQSIDPDQPVFHVRTMQELLHGSVAQPRFRAVLLGVFAAVALALSVIGLYGVISYSVSQRSSELAVRTALGAGSGDLLRLVLREGMRLALIGVLLGVALAFALVRTLSKLLYGVKPADPLTFLLVPLTLLAVTAIAIYLPALRASRTDPALAIR